MTNSVGTAADAGTEVESPTVAADVERWRSVYGPPTANAADLLNDQWDDGATAFVAVRVGGEELAADRLTYGELAERSKRLATGLAALVS